MAPSGSIWHKESLKLKEIFGTREGFEICPNNFSPRPNFSPSGMLLLPSSFICVWFLVKILTAEAVHDTVVCALEIKQHGRNIIRC